MHNRHDSPVILTGHFWPTASSDEQVVPGRLTLAEVRALV